MDELPEFFIPIARAAHARAVEYSQEIYTFMHEKTVALIEEFHMPPMVAADFLAHGMHHAQLDALNEVLPDNEVDDAINKMEEWANQPKSGD